MRCSMTCVTPSSSVFADAPGYLAVMLIVGGAMAGYCATGSVAIASAPASMMTIAMTQAKTGRSMKKRDMACRLLRCRRRRGCNTRHAAGTYFLHALHDHAITGCQTRRDQPTITNGP